MFIKITRINGCGEEKECLLNTDIIVGITEKHTEVQELYDNGGNLIETREAPLLYEIVSVKDRVTMSTIVDKKNYDIVAKVLLGK